MADIFPKTINVDGYELPANLDEETLRAALKHKPRSGDIFLCSYQRCGAQWLQQIVYLILNKGTPLSSMLDFFTTSPSLESCGLEYVDKMRRPGAIKAQLPFTLVPYSPETKYIVVARNPRDTMVSNYYYTNLYFKPEFPQMTLDDYLDIYLKDNMYYGEYMNYLMSWYRHRHEKNVLFLTYETMRAHPKNAVLEIAAFLGSEYENMLKSDPKLMGQVMHHCSFDTMKKMYNDSATKLFNRKCEEILKDDTLPESFKTSFKDMPPSEFPFGDKYFEFMKNGQVGWWKTVLGQKQIERLDKHVADKAKGSDVMDLWKGLW